MDKTLKQLLLKDFILDYLPEADNHRKTVNNEIENVARAVNAFMSKNFGFKVEKFELLQIFESLHYNVYRKRTGWDSETKKVVVSKESEIWSGREDDMIGHYIYVQIDATTVSKLYRSMRTMPSSTSAEKVRDLQLFRNSLSSFIEFNRDYLKC
ncbi:hypothetical protein [Owenweeksia hongkongensis]|uniref:hypothetical protein n=1 Tax=Owenweeksia hongkongensis TaxID=253245 RepID=UPI003A929408